MEWLKWLRQASLRKSLFIIIATSTTVGLILYFLMMSVCMCHAPMSLRVFVKMVLPFLIAICVPVVAAASFYNNNLKIPLIQLSTGAKRIKENDLNFAVKFKSNDELGQLCQSFEAMRVELLKNNREMWQQMEDRKRLNAAFAHDLRNPVTVLKGSAMMLQKGLDEGSLDTEHAAESISLIVQYSARIENYIQAMTSVQKLEELAYSPEESDWFSLVKELKSSLSIIGTDASKEIKFITGGESCQIYVDKFIIQNVAENLVDNALRYSENGIKVDMSCTEGKIMITVLDDGPGFSTEILKKGAIPFLRDNNAEQGQHFGMGLYICHLLCNKHGGSLTLENHPGGAKVTAIFNA